MLHRHLIVNRGYVLIVYKLIVVTKNFISVAKRYIMVWMVVETSYMKDCVESTLVVIQYLYLDGECTFKFEISAISLVCDSYLSWNA